MAQYKLTVRIDNDILKLGIEDSLCLARKVNGVYNTIFMFTRQFSGNNTFEWQNKYRVCYTTRAHAEGSIVKRTNIATNSQEITFGQQAVLKGGVIQNAISVGPDVLLKPETTFAVKGGHTEQHAVLAQLQYPAYNYTPVYVDTHVRVCGAKVIFEPQDEYVLFWRHLNKDDTKLVSIISPTEDNGYVFSFQKGNSSHTVRYGFKKENDPAPDHECATWWPLSSQ